MSTIHQMYAYIQSGPGAVSPAASHPAHVGLFGGCWAGSHLLFAGGLQTSFWDQDLGQEETGSQEGQIVAWRGT